MIAETPLEDIVQRNYIEQQMIRVAPLLVNEKYFPHGFDIQIRSEGRKTDFLKITPEQFRKIEDILRGVA